LLVIAHYLLLLALITIASFLASSEHDTHS
jgi:hypothetical protein